MLYSLATLLFVQAAVSVSEGSLCPLLKASGVSSSEKTGSYIVVLKEETSHEMFLNIKSQIEHLSTDAKLHGSVEKVAKAFTVRLTDLALNIVSIIINRYNNIIVLVECVAHAHSCMYNSMHANGVQISLELK